MIEIVACLQCTCPHMTMTTVRQLSRIIAALLAMTGRVTMLGLSRWAGTGGSYRTVQRFFYTVIPWGIVFGCNRSHNTTCKLSNFCTLVLFKIMASCYLNRCRCR